MTNITLDDFRDVVLRETENDVAQDHMEQNSDEQLSDSTFRSLSVNSLDATDIVVKLVDIHRAGDSSHGYNFVIPDDFMTMKIESLLTYINQQT